MQNLQDLVGRVKAPNQDLASQAQAHLDDLTKPRGALGRLEDLARQLVVIRGSLTLQAPKPAVAVFAADHGICGSGVSAYPQEVTGQMVLNFLAGGAGINVISRQNGAHVVVVDVGVISEFEELPGLLRKKVRPGTADFTQQPAMTAEEALAALNVGAEVAAELVNEGFDFLIPGDMGIGNTAASSALTAVLCGRPVDQVTGRGAGLDDAGLSKKAATLEAAIAARNPQADDAFDVLCKVGGLEIAAIAGFCLEGAARGVPVLLDGFISSAGGLVAGKLCPTAVNYFLAGHRSVELGHTVQLESLGLRPLLELDMRLGEGSGAALALALVRAAVGIYNEMATFSSAGISDKD
ncbi:MAG: nicotinate-nucleotide--dimethylbenzimidazole phosphoribosyltransferase [Deltaproteobacteria bacterium]|nr:nicotinate-nucleotide--dimethylbenzimidazole phosphoribosyltransferase [Deltaproteobacteria bacterium]